MDFSAIEELQTPQQGRKQPKRLTIFRKYRDIRRWLVKHPGVRPLATCTYSAVLIQKTFRGFILRKYLIEILQGYDPRDLKKKVSKNNKKIPTNDKQLEKYLQYLEHRKYSKNYHDLENNPSDPYTNAGFAGWCAIKIQSIFRMRKARKSYLLSQKLVAQVSAIVIQSWWKAFQTEKHVSFIEDKLIPNNNSEHHHPKEMKVIPFEIKCQVSAWQIQRAWRSYCMKRVYWYLRDLIINKFSILNNIKNEKSNIGSINNPFSLSLASSTYHNENPMSTSLLSSASTSSLMTSNTNGSSLVSPGELLKYIIPKESMLLDDIACGLHVRFRLGGVLFPPKIFFKIYTHRPLCDVNAFAPRDYYGDERKSVDINDVDERNPVITKNLLVHHKSSFVLNNPKVATSNSILQLQELKKRDNKDKIHLLKILNADKIKQESANPISSSNNIYQSDSFQQSNLLTASTVQSNQDNNIIVQDRSLANYNSVNQSQDMAPEYSHIQPYIQNQIPESIQPPSSSNSNFQDPSTADPNTITNISQVYLKQRKKKEPEKLSWSLRVGQKFFPAVFKPNYLNDKVDNNEFIDTTNWYQRIEKNGWRPIAAAFDLTSPESYLNNDTKKCENTIPPWFLDGKSLSSNSLKYLPNKNNLIFSNFAIRNEKELRAVKLMLLMENNGKLPETYLSKSVPFLHLTEKNQSYHRKKLLEAQKQAKQYIWKTKSEKLTQNVTILSKKKVKKPIWATGGGINKSSITIEKHKEIGDEFNEIDDLLDWR